MRQYLNPYQFHVPVSIHASVKDATSLGVFNLSYTGVSIHASVKDATQDGIATINLSTGFNPRICKRCDSAVLIKDRNQVFQSTHL